jgi:hypothetical protein
LADGGDALNPIPRRIFLYWEQGFDKAPPVVSLAVASWEKLNSGFDLVLLDQSNVQEWFDGEREVHNWSKLRTSHQSDLLRLALLARYGGYWADATLVCTLPIHMWVPEEPPGGFFMLHTPKGKNRFTQTFFLGSAAQSYFARHWFNSLKRVFESSAVAMTPATQKRWRKRRPLLWANSLTTCLWSLIPLVKITGYPYLVAHYVANRLILTHLRGALTFFRQPKFLAGEALHLQNVPNGPETIRELLKLQTYPLWKLTWRTSINSGFWTSVLAATAEYVNEAAASGGADAAPR